MQHSGRNLFVFVFGITLAIVQGCSAPSNLSGDHYLRFRKIGHIPVVEGKINGKRAYFIIDTGASVSILDESASEHFGFTSLYSSEQQHVVGFSGIAKLSGTKNCVVQLGVLTIRNLQFKTRAMNDLIFVIRQQEDLDIAGILGADFFSRYEIKIDFKRCLISFGVPSVRVVAENPVVPRGHPAFQDQ